MTKRERVLAALKRRRTDRIPRDLGGTESSSLTAFAHCRLNEYLNISGNIEVYEPFQYLARTSEKLREHYEIDTFNLTPGPAEWVERNNPHGFKVLLPAKWVEHKDETGATVIRRPDGSISAKRPDGGHYFDPVNPPLERVNSAGELKFHKEVIFNFDLPLFADEPLEDLKKRALESSLREECVVLNLCCHILAAGQLLRGYENFMVDLLDNGIFVNAFFDFLMEGYFARIAKFSLDLRDHVDVILLNDDLGTQEGPMISPASYREFIKPYQEKLFGYVKKTFGKPLLFHSCGSVREFIPDLIAIGVDALNPVQTGAAGMEITGLKRDFGKDMTFWGAGCDTQTVLNNKTPREVEESVLRNAEILSKDGGFVFCQVHNIQPDVPPENIEAMYRALDRF